MKESVRATEEICAAAARFIFSYEIWGMIVSSHHASSFIDISHEIWLVSYGHTGAPYARGSSTVRTDRGNGACETIWVEEFEILREANAVWRTLTKLSLVLMALSVAALLFI